MEYLITALIFLMPAPAEAKSRPADYSSSVTENCSYSAQDVHTVSENSYKRLLARLRGDSPERKRKRRRRRGSSGSSGQR